MFFFILFHFLARLTTPSAARAARTNSARSAGGRQSRGGQQLGGQSRVSSQSRGPVHRGSQCNCSSSSSSTPSSARTFAAVRAPPPLPKADLSEPCAPPTSGGMVSVPLPSSSPRARSADGAPRERPEGCRPGARVAGRGGGREVQAERRLCPAAAPELLGATCSSRPGGPPRPDGAHAARCARPGPSRRGPRGGGRWSCGPFVSSRCAFLLEGSLDRGAWARGGLLAGVCGSVLAVSANHTVGRVMPSDGGCRGGWLEAARH